jgi:uncharacterized membrane protein (UPF0127 family)
MKNPPRSSASGGRRRILRAGAGLLASLLLATSLPVSGDLVAAGMPVVRLTAGVHVVQAELAADQPSRMEGLMHRTVLGQNNGMLFVFDEAQVHCMWMKNTLIPLSVAFLDDRGTILNIAQMDPQSERTHCAVRPASYALEMNRGWFESRGIRPGSLIRGIPQAKP